MRKPRIHYPGAAYHVMARGVDGRDIFVDDDDRRIFIGKFRTICGQHSARVIAYCLMGNHFHLAIQVADAPLSTIMHRILTSYAAAFNHHRHRSGHLFQARYKSCLCGDDSYLVTLIHYIHLNPVRAGLVRHPSQWPWSSYSEHATVEWNENQINLNDYSRLSNFDPWIENTELQATKLTKSGASVRPSLNSLSGRIASGSGIRIAQLHGSGGNRIVVSAKRAFASLAVGYGWRISEIAVWMKAPLATVSRYAMGK
jgi:REP element-mobilizing transposase RayT